MDENFKLSSPWSTYFKQVEALFSGDPDVTVSMDDDTHVLTITVRDLTGKKGEAIRKLFPESMQMGNVTLTINVNSEIDPMHEFANIIATAFNGNAMFSRVAATEFPSGMSYVYGLFKKEVVQYYNDDLTQFGGLQTTTPANLAIDLIDTPVGFYFSTEVE